MQKHFRKYVRKAMTELNRINKNTKSLNNMPLHERMEYQRVHDRAVVL